MGDWLAWNFKENSTYRAKACSPWDSLVSFFFAITSFQNIGEFGAKKYFTDHQIAYTIQLISAIKEYLFGLESTPPESTW